MIFLRRPSAGSASLGRLMIFSCKLPAVDNITEPSGALRSPIDARDPEKSRPIRDGGPMMASAAIYAGTIA